MLLLLAASFIAMTAYGVVYERGPGLPPDVAKALFTLFTTTKESGLGLGLVIAHDIVRDLGGELNVESSKGGATFIVKLKKVQP